MKAKKCKVCKNSFHPERQLQQVCGYECSIKYAEKHLSKQAKKKKEQASRNKTAFNQNDKTFLKKNAQILVNRYARLRDFKISGKRCCSCGIKKGKMDGGHFLPTSGYSSIRYNVNQIHQQCVKCNRYNGGRYKEYRVFMIDKYSLEYVESLEATKNVLGSYSVEFYQRLIKIIRERIKRYETKKKKITPKNRSLVPKLPVVNKK